MSGSKVWSRFSAKTKDGTTVLKFRIQDMPNDRLKEVIDLLMAHFATEETIHRASGVAKNPEAMKEVYDLYNSLINSKPHQITICLLDEGTEAESIIIGASLMVIATKEELKEDINPEVQTKEMRKLLELIKSLFSKYDVSEDYDFDSFYDDRGVVVLPKYRGLGIAQEFFRVRRLTCREHNIPMTVGWMTSFGSQKAAQRDGWETKYELNYEEFGKEVGVVFDNVPPNCVYMIAKD